MTAASSAIASRRELATLRQNGKPWSRLEVGAALAILLWTAMLSLTWSHLRLMWNDEFLSFYSDSLPTVRDVIHVQRYTPISLDPPTYHLLSHFSMKMAGTGPMALRLPALAGFLLCQGCLFLLIRKIAGGRAALFGMLLPVLMASFRFSVEGRPYALLLGLYALSLLCWYTAVQPAAMQRPRRRWLPLFGLFAAILLAITSHYFGVLILAPFLLAELVRISRRRAIDWPMSAALLAGAASVALILPFKQGLAPYRLHYYITSVSLHAVPRGYRDLFLQDDRVSNHLQRIFAIFLLALVAFMVMRLARSMRKMQRQGGFSTDWVALLAALLALAALPFFGFIVGRLVTHTMEERYVIASLIPFVIAISVALGQRFQDNRVFVPAVCLLGLLATGAAVSHMAADRAKSKRILGKMTLSPALAKELSTHPTERLYVQNTSSLFLNTYYAQNPLVRQRLSAIYDSESELAVSGNDTDAVTANNLRQFRPFSTIRYPDFIAQPAPLLLHDQSVPMDWVGVALREHRVPMAYQGHALGEDVFRVDPAALSHTGQLTSPR